MESRKIELLAPARDPATGRVAVDAGADAVYIGGPGFGARRAAGNSPADIAALVRYARPFGVRVYATLNTLLFDSELAEAEVVARELTDAGVDALIVQDMAWLRMGLGDVEFHASTQTSNIDPDNVAFLGRAGFRRVILERALSLDDIIGIRTAVPEDVEIEVFVHGAICVGYSGRCFLSRAADPARSGNRGDCSQPCRLAYDLTDDAGRTAVKGKHLLSVRDLDLSARLGELLDAGVSSFKIEGRLKDATYVRNVVSHYRALIDKELITRPGLRRASVGVSVPDFTPDPGKSFTRGGTEYYFDGARPGVASFDTPKAVGETVGRVTDCNKAGFVTDNPNRPLVPGDGICFFAEGELRGTNINRVVDGRARPNKCEGIALGTEIFRNFDHDFTRTLERSRMKRRISATVHVTRGRDRVEAAFTDETGLRVSVLREGVFDEARDSGKMADALRAEFARSGDTMFDIKSVEIAGEPIFIPVSMIAGMRREGLDRLTKVREEFAPLRCPAREDCSARFPRTSLTAVENVTNRLAERFYRDHGVVEMAPALELSDHNNRPDEPVMRTRYCIRREIGECLKEGARLHGDLSLRRGATDLRLGFDCAKCEMTITIRADSKRKT